MNKFIYTLLLTTCSFSLYAYSDVGIQTLNESVEKKEAVKEKDIKKYLPGTWKLEQDFEDNGIKYTNITKYVYKKNGTWTHQSSLKINGKIDKISTVNSEGTWTVKKNKITTRISKTSDNQTQPVGMVETRTVTKINKKTFLFEEAVVNITEFKRSK